MGVLTYGTMGVDWEERVNFDRLRGERLGRAKAQLECSELGALLCFDMYNIRYITSTNIGDWARDKLSRFCLLPRGDLPIMWDFGSAAKHHELYCPWLGEGRSRAGISLLRGALTPETGQAQNVARKIKRELDARGLAGAPLGVDVIELPILEALQAEGIRVVDAQQILQAARRIKTADEITLMNTAAMMVDACYDNLYHAMRPGVSENQLVALAANTLYTMGSESVEGVNAIGGERCSPHPHIFSDRVLRPGDPAYYDIIQSYMGYRTCYYRTFAVGSASPALRDAYVRCRDYLDRAIAIMKPGITTADIARLWPRAQDFGFPNEEACFGLQYGHGVGLSVWEQPVISRLTSLDHPVPIEAGMVIALETFWPATDGWSAARIEEEILVTPTGHEVLTRFPAETLIVAGAPYWTGTGPLDGTRTLEPAVRSGNGAARSRA